MKKQIAINIFIILFYVSIIVNGQSCNNEPFTVENNLDNTVLFNITPSGSCWCNNYIGNGAQLLITQNSNLLDIINALNNTITNLNSTIQGLQTSIGQLQQKLQKVTVSNDTNNIYFTGVNLNVVSGSTATNGTINGLGNIIVGYNENDLQSARTGSHNIIVGNNHGYSSYGGIVGGYSNIISGNYSFAVGQNNKASGFISSVSGGYGNTASGQQSSASGGYTNIASGQCSSTSGGQSNGAISFGTSISGGQANIASGYIASVSGGYYNMATSSTTTVSGGYGNIASGSQATVSGGNGNTASGNYATVAGGYNNTALGNYATVAGSSNILSTDNQCLCS